MNSAKTTALTIIALTLWGLIGCRDQSTEIAREAADRQARQSEIIAQTAQGASENARRLGEEESRARRDLILAQGKLQDERNRLLANWSELELSRQAAIERQRRWAATETVGASLAAALAALLALGICWRVMAGQGSSAIDVEAACWLFELDASCDTRTRQLATTTSIDTTGQTTIQGELP